MKSPSVMYGDASLLDLFSSLLYAFITPLLITNVDPKKCGHMGQHSMLH